MRFLKQIRVPSHAEQLENEDKPFVAVWYDGDKTTEERIDRAEAERLLELHNKGLV